MSNANFPSMRKIFPLALCVGLAAGGAVAQTDADNGESMKAYSIESKVILIPKGAEESLGASDRGGVMFVSHVDEGTYILPIAASIESFSHSLEQFADSELQGMAYKVDKNALENEFLPVLHKMKGELLSAPRITIRPDTLFKVVWTDQESGGVSGGGGVSSADSPVSVPFDDSGLSPELWKLLAENQGSSGMIADWRPAKDGNEASGMAFAFVVTPDSENSGIQLEVVTHYRVRDYVMKRKHFWSRKTRVYSGMVDMLVKHEEHMMPEEVFAFYQRLPESGDTLLTLVTVDEIFLPRPAPGAENHSD